MSDAIFVILGAIIGAAGSYYGGIRGARYNYELVTKPQRDTYKKILLVQLRSTYERWEQIDREHNYKLTFGSLYNEDWKSLLSNVDFLEEDEIEAIIKWFTCLDNYDRTMRGTEYSLLERILNPEVDPLLDDIDKCSENVRLIINKNRLN